MTKSDFKDEMNTDEYASFSNFLSVYVPSNGDKMVTIKCNTKRYNTMLANVNTYDEKLILKKALSRVNYKGNTPTRKRTLSKVIEILKDVA